MVQGGGKKRGGEHIQSVLQDIEIVDSVMTMESFKIYLASKLHIEEILWRQEARWRWIKEGDKNAKFFLCMANHGRRINYMKEMKRSNQLVKVIEKMSTRQINSSTSCIVRISVGGLNWMGYNSVT